MSAEVYVEGSPQAAARVPALTLTIVISALFGPFGAIPAAIHASAAAAAGQPRGRYWVAFLVSWAVSTAVVVAATVLFYVLLLSTLAGA